MNSKRKGNAAELELLHLLEARGLPATRNLQQWVGGKGNPDISLPALHVEVKRTETLRLSEALNQAQGDAAPGTLPVVMHRMNRGRWIAIMGLPDFLTLYGPFLRLYVEARDREIDAEYERVRASEL